MSVAELESRELAIEGTGGGLWAVGVTGAAQGNGNYSTLIEYHP